MMKLKGYYWVFGLASVLVFTGTAVGAPKGPTTVAEIALYKGADRQQILEEGAKKEGKLVLYTTATESTEIVKAFQKKYPYIKVDRWRAESRQFLPRIFEEYKAGRYVVGVLGPSRASEIVLEEAGILQPFYSPELAYLEEWAIRKTPGGDCISAAHFQSGVVLAYNTKLIKKDQLPQTYQDLLDPKWKGKMPIVGDEGGVQWMAALLVTHGEKFVNEMAKQKFDIHMVSGTALLDMISAGEYVFSPTIRDSQVDRGKKKGAPVDWIPLEPVSCSLNQIALPKHSAQPHAAMLFIDFDLSKEGGEIWKAQGYNSPRKELIGQRPYKKYFPFESTKEVNELNKLFDKLFLKKGD